MHISILVELVEDWLVMVNYNIFSFNFP